MDDVEVFLEFLEVFDEGCYCFVEVCCGAGVGGRGLGDDCVHWEGGVDVVILGEGKVGKVLRVEGTLFLIHSSWASKFRGSETKGGFSVFGGASAATQYKGVKGPRIYSRFFVPHAFVHETAIVSCRITQGLTLLL